MDELLSCWFFKLVKIIVIIELLVFVDIFDFILDDFKIMSEFVFFENVGSGYFSNMSFFWV